MDYKPTKESVDKHPIPNWYNDAKFGIFIHWSISAVPAFAPTDKGDIIEILRRDGSRAVFKNQPYTEWYLNSIRIKGSPAWAYHNKTYGAGYDYYRFADDFNTALDRWDPAGWAELFREVGARYVVFVTKHHDGFLLWPSEHPNPMRPNLHASRNVVKELTDEVKSRGMRMGYYYSSPYDWTFTKKPITDLAMGLARIPGSEQYREYATSHWYELIDKFEPSVLWSDIGYPYGVNINEIFSYFYNKNPDGVINERWGQTSNIVRYSCFVPGIRQFIDRMARDLWLKGSTSPPGVHYDFTTPEYTSFSEISKDKWESVRGIGKSFGYNSQEKPEDYMSIPDLVKLLVDIVSKNGNLLLNVGPKPGGEIPEVQVDRIKGVGKWLALNGDAIYGTRPWKKAEGRTGGAINVRFTAKGGTLYAVLMDTPETSQIMIEDLKAPDGMKAVLVENGQPLEWKQAATGLKIEFGARPPEGITPCIKMTPQPY